MIDDGLRGWAYLWLPVWEGLGLEAGGGEAGFDYGWKLCKLFSIDAVIVIV